MWLPSVLSNAQSPIFFMPLSHSPEICKNLNLWICVFKVKWDRSTKHVLGVGALASSLLSWPSHTAAPPLCFRWEQGLHLDTTESESNCDSAMSEWVLTVNITKPIISCWGADCHSKKPSSLWVKGPTILFFALCPESYVVVQHVVCRS